MQQNVEDTLLVYRQPALSPEERTADLLKRMSLKEKAAQMVGIWQQKAVLLVDDQGRFDVAKARSSFKEGHGLGQVGRPSDAGSSGHEPEKGRSARELAELTNAIQKFFIEESRLGIPVLFHEECLHGLAAIGGTSFPQPIALGATFNPELVEALYAMAALETRVRGAHQALTPVVDVARDPRWGRVEETFGEDPYLVGTMGIAAVKGFQGDGQFADKTRVLATLKHFAAHGQPEAGMNCGPVNVSERELRDTFLEPFRRAIHEGSAVSVMAAYNEIDGVPCHANSWLLRQVLRDEWGFKGFVVSDYYAIWELCDRPETHGHHVAANKKQAAALAVRAGVNIELPEPDCYRHLIELVKEGHLAESELDDLVAPMLHWKFKLGLFDDPYVDPEVTEQVVNNPKHQALALEAAHNAMTLLKNEDNVLPLSLNDPLTIAVIGPNADRELLGGYSGVPPQVSTVLEGIRERAAGRARVVYAEGCTITVGGSWNEDAVTLNDLEADQGLIDEAVEVARAADIIVLALGGNEQTAREAWSLNHMGDRTSLEPFGRQHELVSALSALGKPTVGLVFNGRPLAITQFAEKIPALIECWYLGQETGRAVADVLFGEVNPSGKLPISIPRSVGHLPAYYNHKPSARRGYLFDEVSPLYAFGFGLSYTSFAINNVRLSEAEITIDGATQVRVEVTNTGLRAGAEVVQLYIRDKVSSVTRPVKELKGFQRVFLEPGESRAVVLPIAFEQLAFHTIHLAREVEPGDFDIMVGTSSRDQDLITLSLHVVAS